MADDDDDRNMQGLIERYKNKSNLPEAQAESNEQNIPQVSIIHRQHDIRMSTSSVSNRFAYEWNLFLIMVIFQGFSSAHLRFCVLPMDINFWILLFWIERFL